MEGCNVLDTHFLYLLSKHAKKHVFSSSEPKKARERVTVTETGQRADVGPFLPRVPCVLPCMRCGLLARDDEEAQTQGNDPSASLRGAILHSNFCMAAPGQINLR